MPRVTSKMTALGRHPFPFSAPTGLRNTPSGVYFSLLTVPPPFTTSESSSRGILSRRAMFFPRLWPAIAILLVLGEYVATVTAGHNLIQDDFAAYIMHAANLVEGHRYADMHYVRNPLAIGFVPAGGYPPAYPLILAPVYKIWGVNLRAMKIVTVLCFGVALAAFALFFERSLPPWAISGAIVLMGFNLAFWEQHDYLLSEFCYMMFSLCALAAAQMIYRRLEPQTWSLSAALLLALLLYGAYATRTVGIVLLPALILADILKFRRPSKFLIAVVLLTTTAVLIQNMRMVSPKEYMNVVHLSANEALQHFIYYGKTLSYVWQNGVSKPAQIVFALLFTSLAAARLGRDLWSEKSVAAFYVLGYVAVLLVWGTEIGMRGLLPILPLYIGFGLQEMIALGARLRRPWRVACAAAVVLFVATTYASAVRWNSRQPRHPDVATSEARELFNYLKQNTRPDDLLVFQKPRILALFTGRSTTMLAPDEPAAASAQFFSANHARFLIQNQAMSYPIPEYIAAGLLAPQPVFQNAAFQVYKINSQP